jgi:hypothetical protein
VTDKDFDIKDFNENVFSEEYKKEQIKKLSLNYAKLKSLSMENVNILRQFYDPEKNDKVFDCVDKIWLGNLEVDTYEHSLEDIVNLSLECAEDVKFFDENKHKQFFPAVLVMEKHMDHPTQKMLMKEKLLGRRDVKKQKTPMQTIKMIYKVKSDSDQRERLKALEDVVSALQDRQSNFESTITQKTAQIEDDVSILKNRLLDVRKVVKKPKKFQLYQLYAEDDGKTNQEMADILGVSLRTVKYWLKELRELGVID